MKIALVCPYNMFEHFGGVQQQVVHLYDGLKKRGHSVKIITPKPTGFNGKVPEDYILLGSSTKYNPFNPAMSTSAAWSFDVDSEEVKTVFDVEKFDVIHFHEPWMPLLGRQMLQHSETAHVGTFHANLVDSVAAKSIVNTFGPYGRGIAEKMHVMTAVSAAPAALFINKYPEHELVKNIKYIPNGIDLATYKPFSKRLPLNGPNTKTIVFVGRLDKRKGVDWLIKAFALLINEMPNAHLIVAGNGGRRYNLEQQVKALKLKNVRFAGFVSDEEKRRLIGNADLFCSPAMYGESLGVVLLEAMAMGTPMLAGNNGGYASVMKGHGRIGLLDAEATEDFANRLAVFLSDESLRRLVREWGLKEIKKYDYAKVIDQYEAAYKEAIAIVNKSKLVKNETGLNAKPRRTAIRRLFVRRHAG